MTTPRQAESDLRAGREQVAQDLRRMTRLHELSVQLVGPGDVRAMLEAVLDAAVDITAADMGNMQYCDEAGVLKIAAQTGFERPFLDFFAVVDAATDTTCGAVLTNRQRVLAEDVTTSPVYVGLPSLAVMTGAGVRAVQSTPLFDRSGRFLGVFSTHYRTVHHFGEAELRWLDLLARHAADVIGRQHVEDLLTQSHRELETRVAERTRWLSLMHDVARAINQAGSWDDALRRILRRLCEAEHWQIGYVYLPQPGARDVITPAISCVADEQFRPFHVASEQERYARGESLPGRVYAKNTPLWASRSEELLAALPRRAAAAARVGLQAAVALPVATGDEVLAVLELFSDQPRQPPEQLVTLMNDVGDQIARVLERERATARTAELIWREQQDLLHALHDSLGQILTGLGMLSTGLRQRLTGSDPGAAETAAEIARQTQQGLDQVRHLAKSLFPLEVEGPRLLAALQDLAAATESLHKIRVRVEDGAFTELRDGNVATELYRIAQEAVTNSVKHARASTIMIRLEGPGGVRLRIADDGIGIPSPGPSSGIGLQIMRHRAASIGASLTVERGAPGGTVVTCTLLGAPGSEERAA